MRFDSTTGRAAGRKTSVRKRSAAQRNATRPRPTLRGKSETETDCYLLSPPRSPGRPPVPDWSISAMALAVVEGHMAAQQKTAGRCM